LGDDNSVTPKEILWPKVVANLFPPVGRETGNNTIKGKGSKTAFLIEIEDAYCIIPTSRSKAKLNILYPGEVHITMNAKSKALCTRIQSIPQNNIKEQIGIISEEDKSAILNCWKKYFIDETKDVQLAEGIPQKCEVWKLEYKSVPPQLVNLMDDGGLFVWIISRNLCKSKDEGYVIVPIVAGIVKLQWVMFLSDKRFFGAELVDWTEEEQVITACEKIYTLMQQ